MGQTQRGVAEVHQSEQETESRSYPTHRASGRSAVSTTLGIWSLLEEAKPGLKGGPGVAVG